MPASAQTHRPRHPKGRVAPPQAVTNAVLLCGQEPRRCSAQRLQLRYATPPNWRAATAQQRMWRRVAPRGRGGAPASLQSVGPGPPRPHRCAANGPRGELTKAPWVGSRARASSEQKTHRGGGSACMRMDTGASSLTSRRRLCRMQSQGVAPTAVSAANGTATTKANPKTRPQVVCPSAFGRCGRAPRPTSVSFCTVRQITVRIDSCMPFRVPVGGHKTRPAYLSIAAPLRRARHRSLPQTRLKPPIQCKTYNTRLLGSIRG